MNEVITNSVRLLIEYGALSELPVRDGRVLWESHPRGKNWLATIAPDPKSPNGLARKFLDKAKGDYFYLLPPGALRVGEAIEIGADYYTGGGSPQRRRWYGVVSEIGPDHVDLIEYPTPAKAMAAGQAIRPPEPPKEADESARVAADLARYSSALLIEELERRGLAGIDRRDRPESDNPTP